MLPLEKQHNSGNEGMVHLSFLKTDWLQVLTVLFLIQNNVPLLKNMHYN